MASIHDIPRDSDRYFQKWKGIANKLEFCTPISMVTKSDPETEFEIRYYISYQPIDRFVS